MDYVGWKLIFSGKRGFNFRKEEVMKKRWCLISLLCGVFLGFGFGEVRAFDLAEGNLSIRGFLSNETAWRLQDDEIDMWKKGNLSMSRNTLQLEWDLKLAKNLSIYGITRGVYDGAFDLDHSTPEVPREDINNHLLLREIHLHTSVDDFLAGKLDFSIGKQQVVWGESDAIRLTDVVNPLDITWRYTFTEWEDIRIPLWLLRMIYSPYVPVGPIQDFNVELVYIPFQYESLKSAPPGHNWAIPTPPSPIPVRIVDHKPSADQLRNGEIGMRVQGKIGGWDMSLYDFYTRDDNPIGTFKGFTLRPLAINVALDYKQLNIIGFTFNKEATPIDSIIRGEFSYTLGQPYSDVSEPDMVEEKDTFQLMLGLDRPTMCRWLNPNHSFFISAQFFDRIIMNYDDDLVSGWGRTLHRHMMVTSLLINTAYRYETIKPQILGVWCYDGNGFVQPKVEYVYGDWWTFTVGATFIRGSDPLEPPWGWYDKNDEVFFMVKFAF